MLKLSVFLISLLASPFAHAARPIPELTCLNAGGFYGNLAIRHIGLEVEVIGQQGYAFELASQLGLKEAARIDLRFASYQCTVHAHSALHCQGSIRTLLEGFGDQGIDVKVLDADVLVQPTNPGHVITIALKDPATGKTGTDTVNFGDCKDN